MTVSDGHNWYVETNLKMYPDKRVRIPENFRERYGIGEGDIVKVRVHSSYPDEDAIDLGDTLVRAEYRVSIPAFLLDSHGLSPGDYIDLEIGLPAGES